MSQTAPSAKGKSDKSPPLRGDSLRCINDIRTYWFQVTDDAGDAVIVSRPQYPVCPNDSPTLLRVVTDCMIVLRLYNSAGWQFDHHDCIVFNSPGAPEYYQSLTHMYDDDNRCYGVSFHAKYRKDHIGPTVKMDSFTIKLIPFPAAFERGSTSPKSLISFDPDIQNPGDDPNQN